MSEKPEWEIKELSDAFADALANACASALPADTLRMMAAVALDYMEKQNGDDMAKGMRMTRKNARTVLTAIADQIEESKEDAEVYCRVLNELLDELLGEDFFGTEGQCDPRGDRRSL